MKLHYLLILCFFSNILWAQEEQDIPENLKEVTVSAHRIEIPFSKDSRSISIITAEDLKNSPARTLAEVLQQEAGIDIRRRGTNGMQADLYIRGGGFDQTLVLIDGIKMDDAQTGHHILNAALPLEIIERVEIIKGPAARIYGQNAFTGAINIITKKHSENRLSLSLNGGSYEQLGAAVSVAQNFENSRHLVHFSKNISEGYRYNTDYDSQNYFLKSEFNSENTPVEVMASYNDRKFGANGFYATPSAIHQYEETQTSLVGISTQYALTNFKFTPQIYWRRNQDLYLFDRQNPAGYRNLHISNKYGAQINAAYSSSLGLTGLGINFEYVDLRSNNLGNRHRSLTTLFLEHRFKFFNDKADFTPGLAMSYFSDFKFHFFPGFDFGYEFHPNFKAYANAGYTYRIPTYTDLFYSDPTTLGNENLKPEEAISEEIGFKFTSTKINVLLSFFNRDSKNLIDFIKENEEDKFMATNIRRLNTKGFETSVNYHFSVFNLPQNIDLGYNFLDDTIEKMDLPYSRYAINSLKHQVTAKYTSRFIEHFTQTLLYKYAVRTAGDTYGVVDVAVNYRASNLELSLQANNIFNTEYTESNLVPMPKGNVLLGVTYNFR